MRIAILYDDFSACGGGVKLIGILAKGLIDQGIQTDIYTYSFTPITKKILPKGIKVKTIINKKFLSKDKIVRQYLFSKLRLGKDYDFFIFSGDESLGSARFNKPNILYLHNIYNYRPFFTKNKVVRSNPKIIRETRLQLIKNSYAEKIWFKLYKIKNRISENPIPLQLSNFMDFLRFLFANNFDIGLAIYALKFPTKVDNIKHIQKVITNSQNIKDKLKKEYGIDSIVIHPPIDTKKYKYMKNRNFWVSINRIIPLKRIELQLRAFSKIPNEKLYIIGQIEDAKYYKILKKIQPNNVRFLGVVSEKELIKKLSECKGMLFTAKDEDFGMACVEAMASGKPVIACNEGGCKETILNRKTGILINDIRENKIVWAIKKIDRELKKNPLKYKDACLKQARNFDVEVFIRKIKEEIKKEIKNV